MIAAEHPVRCEEHAHEARALGKDPQAVPDAFGQGGFPFATMAGPGALRLPAAIAALGVPPRTYQISWRASVSTYAPGLVERTSRHGVSEYPLRSDSLDAAGLPAPAERPTGPFPGASCRGVS